jgi:glycogen debranching enzyme
MTTEPVQPSPWVLATEPTSLGDPSNLVTLVDGQTFCLSGRTGDFNNNPTHGVFFADMRVLSTARLLVDGATVESLAVTVADASTATFVGRSRPPAQHQARVLVVRRRSLGAVWHERIELRNTGDTPVTAGVEFEVAADFANVFAVKAGRNSIEGSHSVSVERDALVFCWTLGNVQRTARLSITGADHTVATAKGFAWTVTLDRHQTATVHFDLAVAIGERWIERADHHPSVPDAAARNRRWFSAAPRLRTLDRTLGAAYEQSLLDIGALRLHDPTGRHRPVIAAGAPWYMALFGRDALLAAYMALPIDPTLALGVLQALGELQGTKVDPLSEEEPGRIMHETRQLDVISPTLTGGSTYYGSVDATPLYVVLLGELLRWGLPTEVLLQLLPHADRAVEWLRTFGDKDGDGYIEYLTTSARGLANQGWKDSGDGIRYGDGRVAEAPLALCEVQGYAYAALRARADIATHLGDQEGAACHHALADELQQRFNRDFWLPERGWFAVALRPDGTPVDSLASNMGHCLWSGIVDRERAGEVAAQLMSPSMWSGWGIRTLANTEPGYDPMSYHCGTVWPHDAALCAAGLRRYGFAHEALTVARGLLAASESWQGRLPELFCGLDRTDVDIPVPFPTSCAPQAWAAATPFLLLRTMLGLEPTTDGGMTIDPITEAFEDELWFLGVRRCDGRFDIRIENGRAEVVRAGDGGPVPPPRRGLHVPR